MLKIKINTADMWLIPLDHVTFFVLRMCVRGLRTVFELFLFVIMAIFIDFPKKKAKDYITSWLQQTRANQQLSSYTKKLLVMQIDTTNHLYSIMGMQQGCVWHFGQRWVFYW